MIVEKSKLHDVGKRIDSQLPNSVVRGNKTAIFWLHEQFREMYTHTRPGFRKLLPDKYDPLNQSEVIKYFNLKGFEYGNWLSQEDRYNYLMACQIALFDLKKVTGINNVGLNKNIGIAFGSRGSQGALAHFEPDTNMINITRYHEARKSGYDKTTGQIKQVLFEVSGGIGSLAHEYGHALDYVFGGFIEPDKKGLYRSLTKGRSIANTAELDYPVKSMRYYANHILNTIIWSDTDKIYTTFYAKLRKCVKEGFLTEYWIRHNELFARSFESYIQIKLAKKKIENSFLTHGKYTAEVYPDQQLMKKVEPLFDSLLKLMAKTANK